MAAPQAMSASLQDRRPSPALAINLSSNNPFRRAVSPGRASPMTSPRMINNNLAVSSSQSTRPSSTNPFLDSYKVEAPSVFIPAPRSQSPVRSRPLTASNRQPTSNSNNAELLNGLSLTDKPLPPRSETLPAQGHRSKRSQDARIDVKPHKQHPKQDVLDIFATSTNSENRRPRRNSETSVMDVKDEDRKRRERRHRERDGKSTKDGKPRERSTRPKRPNERLDLIDKLDVTSIYGSGLFHHDGPFDACNPSRNKKGLRAAPMQAFPANSANNSMGGSGPVNKGLDFDRFHGRGAEGFTDYNATVQQSRAYERTNPDNKQNLDRYIRDAKQAIEPVHGELTAGLGTSTFLEGAPVPRSALQRHASDNDGTMITGGLQRKKSLAQKLRGMSRQRPGEAGNVVSPESRYEHHDRRNRLSPESPGHNLTGPQSAGASGRPNEINPFFADQAAKKGPVMHVNRLDGASMEGGPVRSRYRADSLPQEHQRTNSSPQNVLVRTSTNEDGSSETKSTGLLGRVKSMRGRKTRPERSGSTNDA